LGIASPVIGAAAFLALGAGSSSGAVIALFWALQGVAVLLAVIVLFWRGSSMPAWARALGALTLVAEAAFVWVLYQGLSRLS
jgi:hypothetical protein